MVQAVSHLKFHTETPTDDSSTMASPIHKVLLLYFLLSIGASLCANSQPSRRLMKAQEAAMAGNLTKSKTKSSSIKSHLNKSMTLTAKTLSKKLNPTYITKPSSNITKKSLDLPKSKTPKLKIQTPTKRTWPNEADSTDFVAEIRHLPFELQRTLLPDLERISTTSKDYLSRANNEITKGFKPIVGTKYAPTIASLVSFIFIMIPLVLVSLLINRIKAYFSLQKLLIFIQAYLSIYFSILSLSSLLTGLEPLKFLHSTSMGTYICLQLMQTMCYVMYLLMLLMYLVLVFSTDSGLGSKFMALGQTLVGYAVGLHYYVTVAHRTVLHLPPRTNWLIHLIYATCFLAVCMASNLDRRKKTYLQEDGAQGKLS